MRLQLLSCLLQSVAIQQQNLLPHWQQIQQHERLHQAERKTGAPLIDVETLHIWAETKFPVQTLLVGGMK